MIKRLFSLFISALAVTSASAQNANAEKLQSQANNPLANMTSIGFHNYYIPKLTDASNDAYMNSTWFRFAKPFADGKFLIRVSAPINTIGIPTTDGITKSKNGLGDINGLLVYNFVSKPTSTVGLGTVATAPTATDRTLGTGKWQGGLSLIGYFSKSPTFQYGGLVTWQTSFAGDKDRASTNNAAVQPFLFWQMGKGYYLRSAPIWVFDFKNDQFHMPFALGAGKILKINKTIFNLFVEPQYSVLHHGMQPQFQIFTGINIQLLN